jgi:AmmeMemoRadiSam system protein A
MKALLLLIPCAAALFFLPACTDSRSTQAKPTRGEKENDVNNQPVNQYSLTRDERKTLLAIARDTVEKYVKESRTPDLKAYALTDRLREKRGAFVTITNPKPSSPVYPEPLRGCIGNFVGERPLCETVREMAVAACSSDTRFPPVSAKELTDISIEISVLSPLEPIKDPLTIRKGVHGIYIKPKRGWGGGTYLPQVWSEHFPDKDAEYFWTHLCRYKAGLPADAWRHPDQYDVLAYTAEVFGEGE